MSSRRFGGGLSSCVVDRKGGCWPCDFRGGLSEGLKWWGVFAYFWLPAGFSTRLLVSRCDSKNNFYWIQGSSHLHDGCSQAGMSPSPFAVSASLDSSPFSSPLTASSSSSGVPSLQAHASTNLNVSLFQSLFISNNRIGTRAMMMTGNAGAPLVSVTTKMMTVTMIWTRV